jgi:hypothetical protein
MPDAEWSKDRRGCWKGAVVVSASQWDGQPTKYQIVLKHCEKLM